jgi:hypothetical protein
VETVHAICIRAGRYRVLDIDEPAKAFAFAVDFNKRLPFAVALIPANAVDTAFVGVSQALIFAIFLLCHDAQIIDFIVLAIMVNVVDVPIWPFAIFHRPYNSMRWIGATKYRAPPVA